MCFNIDRISTSINVFLRYLSLSQRFLLSSSRFFQRLWIYTVLSTYLFTAAILQYYNAPLPLNVSSFNWLNCMPKVNAFIWQIHRLCLCEIFHCCRHLISYLDIVSKEDSSTRVKNIISFDWYLLVLCWFDKLLSFQCCLSKEVLLGFNYFSIT